MTGGIGYEIDQLSKLGVPELMRRQSVDPQLKYALALQEASKIVEAAARERDMSQQMPTPTNVVGQMETSLAKRLAPGVQQQGRRSMQMQNRAAMGLPGQAAPNMARMADGGIVGYAQGGMPKVGEKSKGPIPQMSPEENAEMLKYLEGLKKFDYYSKNPDKVSPEGRQALELERRMFEEQFSPQLKQKVNEMMYGPSEGMAMGGAVRRYQSGGGVQIGDIVGGEEIVAEVGGVFMTQADYDRYLRNLDLRKAIVQSTNRTADATRGVDSTPTQIDITRGADVTAPQAASPEERAMAQRARAEQFKETAGEKIGGLMGLIGRYSSEVLPEQTRLAREGEDVTTGRLIGATGRDVAALPGRISDALLGENFFDDVVAGYRGTETGEAPSAASSAASSETPMEVPITSGQPTPQTTVPPTAAQRLGSMVDKPSAMLRDNMDERAAQESGIRGLLSRIRPFADKASDIAKILGRGAGASEGYEFAQIADESRKIDAAQRAFEQTKEIKKMDIDARNAELARRLAEAAKIAGQELKLDAYNNAVNTMRMDRTYMDAAEKLKEKYTTGANDYIPFNERFDEEGYNAALLELEEEYLKNKVLAAERVAGIAGTAQTPATQRYQVVQ